MLARLALALFSVALLAACHVDVAVDVVVEPDGSGTVVVGVGLDDAALSRVGDLRQQLRTDDLVAAGWEVAEPVREEDVTWVRASKAFAEPAAATAVVGEVAGDDGPFRGFLVSRREGLLGTDYEVTGTVDLTAGPQVFSDADLATLLGGDPFGGTLEAIAASEGQPVDQMVDFQVTVSLPGGEVGVVGASFTDAQPTAVEVSSSQPSALARAVLWLGIVALVAAAVGVALVVRSRARHPRGSHYR